MSDPQFSARIVDELKRKFGFKKLTGKYMQQGKCPGCDKHTLWCLAERPMVVKCDRQDNCGYDESVHAILPDLFEDWSKRAPVTPDDPNATADAYLRGERGLDLTGLRGHFSQEHYHDNARGIGSATVRFPLPNNTWWERIIDRPGRFDRKARFKFGGSYAGHWWAHPLDSPAVLAGLDEVWLMEGIFDAAASRQNFPKGDAKLGVALRTAVSVMSTNNYPEHALAALADACAKSGRKGRPKLVFAYDVGPAGVAACKAHVKRGQIDGWDATAAQVRPDGEGTKLDWNDLALRHADWKDDGASSLTGPLRPFSEKALELYQWNGAVTLASTPREKARLIQKGPDGLRDLRSFEMRFDNRIYWVKSVFDKEDNSSDLSIEEIANCAFRILYRERDDAADETNYFIQIDFPGRQPTDKARFTAACCAASGEFKKRLFAFSGMWSGSQDQLDRLMRGQTRQMKTVEPLHFTGYSAKHKAWVLGDIAVRDGRVIPINKESCFDFGKHSVKLATTERLLTIDWDPDKADFSWLDDLWTAWGPRGVVTLAFFTMSLFAQQIRAAQASLAFLEITGPPGSGKTTLIEFCWKLLGRPGYEGSDPNKNSAAGMARTFQKVANLPVGLIEGNRAKDQAGRSRQFDWSELLVLFNGRSPRTVGRKSGGTETFEPPFLGSIYLMQNQRIDADPPVLERLMSFPIDKAGWSPATKEAAQRIAAVPIKDVSGYIVHTARWEERFLKAYFDRYATHEKAMPRRVPDLHNGRLIHNHSQLAAAVEALGQLLPVKREWIAETIKLIDWMALDRQHSCGADHPLIQRFWEQVDYLSSIETLNSTRPINLHRKPAERIAISIPLYEEKCRAHGQQAVDSAQLHKLLSGSKRRKFIGKQGVNCVDGKNRHCWLFEAGVPLTVSIDSADDVL